MCEFEVWAVYCPCMDTMCKLKVTELGETYKTHAGHIAQVTTVFRTWKPTCLGMFTNNDPERLLVQWGMDPDNANSTQDCRNARYVIREKSPQVFEECCDRCQVLCEWQGSRVPSVVGSGPRAEDFKRSA